MRVTVLYFAAVRDLVGRGAEALELPPGITSIASFARHLEHVHAPLAGRLDSVRFARNEEFARAADVIAEGDTLAVLPPVAGG